MMTRVVGVFAEDFQHKLDLVVEGHDLLRGEIQELARNTDERFNLVDFKIDTLNKKIDTVDEKLSKKIDAVDEKLSKKIDAVDEKLSREITAVDEKLSQKIGAVDKNISKHIDVVATELKAHRADTEAHHGVWRVREGPTA